ncbi:MAG: hypothetical protein AYL29_013250 [Candidatus Bathyarchaeota archaeon B24]|nr:MAG: hypothetical protein AYL29_013250 [Candidatus Bathyarchaeota archaeon B24]
MERRNVWADRGFIYVLGPTPALTPGGKEDWDGGVLESSGVFKDGNTYYWYYHAWSADEKLWPSGYRVGVATAPTPLGPWRKYEKNPILDHGPRGSWDDSWVACAVVLKEGAYDIKGGTEKYYMFYSASGSGSETVDIGLAVADNPLGPWRKYEKNPIVEDFGYLGGVVKVGGKFYMYTEHPIGVTDQGPFCVAVADRPEGPWKKYEGNPILKPGDWGSWDDGGFSEAGVTYRDGVFHVFYGGTKTTKLESVGYAYSFDGYNFIKYPGNPVIDRAKIPDCSALAEVHHLIEPPYIYVFHTLRYISRGGEDLAVQVLVPTGIPFKISFPILSLGGMEAGEVSELKNCLPVSLEHASTLALTTKCTYSRDAKAGVRVHVRSSPDGLDYDTVDLHSFDIDYKPGKTVQKTVGLKTEAKFIKVIVENLDNENAIPRVNITATVGG